MENYFSDLVVEKPEFSLLPEGDNVVRLIRFEEVDSFTNYDGTEKTNEKGWDDATPQLAITVVAAEDGKSGGLSHRFNGMGFVKYDELTDKQKQSDKYMNVDGYACEKKGDQVVRILDPERTKSCKNILMQFANAAGCEPGVSLADGLNKAIADGHTFTTTVTVEEYDGKDQHRLTSFKKAVAAVEADGFGD
jgi:hypothetical protein